MIASERKVGAEFLAGGGEMGERIRAFDWALTPLGPIASWPHSLKTAVSLILSSRHPMWIGWGPEMTFLYNDAYVHVLGPAKHPSALGQPASQVWAEIWDVCGPLADKVFGQGEASFMDDVRLFMNRGDFLEETFYSFSYSPIRDDSGNVCGLFCPSTDVTAKVLSARRLATLSELASHALIEKTTRAACAIAADTLAKNPDDIPFALLYIADGNGRYAELEQSVGDFANNALKVAAVDLQNPAEETPWPIAAALQTSRRQTVDLSDVEGLPEGVAQQPIASALVLPLTSRGEHTPYGVLVAGVNPCRPLEADHITFFELVASQVATAIQNARAAEEEKKRADMLAEIDKAKTVFFSNVSHEFRTPLTLMLGPLENLLAKPDSLPREVHQDLAVAHRNSLRLLKLVNSLLDFSRLEAGRLTANYVATDLGALTADLASNFRSAMQTAGLEYVVECDLLPDSVYVDREMWEKIVLNLLSNAFKFTFAGRVVVRLSADRGLAVLTVADTGTGIPEQELPRVFERFHRVEGAKGRTYEGTGIGLALIQEYAKLHGGSISVESAMGKGSTFVVQIPFGTAHLPRERTRETADRPVANRSRAQIFTGEAETWLPRDSERVGGETLERADPATRPRIVVADDNSDMRDYVNRILGSDYALEIANDGQQALEMIRRNPPDLVLTDIMMPVMDGLGLLRAIRSDAQMRTLPVIFVSARAGEEMTVEGLASGADDYLVKPFTGSELLARVGTHVQMALLRRAATAREALLRGEAEAARDEAVSVFETITDGFIAVDSEWRVTYVNGECERISGMRREEMLGRNHWELFPSSAGTSVQREFERARSEQTLVTLENYYAPWRRWFHIKAYPAKNGGLLIFFQDVTERKALDDERAMLLSREREARDEAETLNQVARTVGGELDLHKLVQTVTDGATRLTGAKFGAFFYNVLDQKGESYVLYTLSGAPREAFEKFGLPRNTPIFEPTFRGTRIVRSDDILKDRNYGTMPPHHGMPKGHLPVRSYLAVPVVSRNGDVLGGLFFGHPDPGVFTERSERLAVGIASHAAVAIDNARLFSQAEVEIGQRRVTEALLRRSEENFRQLADTMPQMVWTTRPDGHADYFNERWYEFTGMERDKFGDASWEPLLHSDDRERTYKAWYESVETGQPYRTEYRFWDRKLNRWRWFLARGVPVLDENGNIVKWFGTCTDIDEQKRVEDELRNANQDLEQFAYSASHDLQEPLRSINIYGELLAKRYGSKLDGQAFEFLEYLRSGAARMESLVRDLLAYTQVTRLDPGTEQTDASVELAAVIENLSGAIQESGGRVTSDPLPTVRVHSTHLKQVFQNLIGNAIKYRSPERSPAVHVSAARENGSWVFSVRDNGIGIDGEYKEHIFGLFKRLHTSEEYSGTGIGLAICQRIVERYHGRIWVQSEPQEGSTFFFTLPV